jgi:hypothetical protein
MSYLAGDKINGKYEGLKFVLDNANSSKIKIGHEKLS